MTRYRGRFAPSPTGALHFGSLVAAMGSYLDARAHQGEWIVRMEDVDRNREVPGAAADILHTLERFGFEWDGEVLYQSQRSEHYAATLDHLVKEGLAYPCGCSRREVIETGRAGFEGPIYAGTCRNGVPPAKRPRAIRLLTREGVWHFSDRIHGRRQQHIAQEVGDFVVLRADGFHAYHLAVVVDDAAQGITHVVRGADLLYSTPRQIYLQELLGLPTLQYAHLPLIVDSQGRKLSKQQAAAPVETDDPLPSLLLALRFLQQPLPPETPMSISEFWDWAKAHWRIESLPANKSLPLSLHTTKESFGAGLT
ncbi:MAG TPA: tRNA glutamyl-Q(34) synthetase GluQRS [Chromatiales bacterium]|nr:tRNA glutamyl-Q(34) synthetase GluQRS [Chromatiales bacterium]